MTIIGNKGCFAAENAPLFTTTSEESSRQRYVQLKCVAGHSRQNAITQSFVALHVNDIKMPSFPSNPERKVNIATICHKK
jgi:hypothetical protein|tara:strand:- start:6697 stop:6936 length:240 start_codon:yes stop_codon:yes gene_type:complete